MYTFLVGLMLYVPANSYGHVGAVWSISTKVWDRAGMDPATTESVVWILTFYTGTHLNFIQFNSMF